MISGVQQSEQNGEVVTDQDRPAMSLEEATQVSPARRGAGRMRWRRSRLRVLVEETQWPSLSNAVMPTTGESAL